MTDIPRWPKISLLEDPDEEKRARQQLNESRRQRGLPPLYPESGFPPRPSIFGGAIPGEDKLPDPREIDPGFYKKPGDFNFVEGEPGASGAGDQVAQAEPPPSSPAAVGQSPEDAAPDANAQGQALAEGKPAQPNKPLTYDQIKELVREKQPLQSPRRDDHRHHLQGEFVQPSARGNHDKDPAVGLMQLKDIAWKDVHQRVLNPIAALSKAYRRPYPREALMRIIAGFFLAALVAIANPSLATDDNAALFDEIEKRRLELLVLRAQLSTASSVYRLDIYDSPNEQSFDRFVDIRCIRWCKHDKVFREVVDNPAIAAFVLYSGAQHFVTIWGAGAVATGTRIYFVTDEEVRLVLDEAGRGGPRFEIAPDGSPLVIMTDFQTPISERSLTTEEVWRWNGKEYESLGKNCVDNCDNDNRLP